MSAVDHTESAVDPVDKALSPCEAIAYGDFSVLASHAQRSEDRIMSLHVAADAGLALVSSFGSLGFPTVGGSLRQFDLNSGKELEVMVADMEFRNAHMVTERPSLVVACTPATTLLLRRRADTKPDIQQWAQKFVAIREQRQRDMEEQSKRNRAEQEELRRERDLISSAVAKWHVASEEKVTELFEQTRRAVELVSSSAGQRAAALALFKQVLEQHAGFVPALVAAFVLSFNEQDRNMYVRRAQKVRDYTFAQRYFQFAGLGRILGHVKEEEDAAVGGAAAGGASARMVHAFDRTLLGYCCCSSIIPTFKERGHESIACLQKAAEEGEMFALFAMGYMYDSGTGVAVDAHKASSLYEEAARKGHAVAACNLAVKLQYSAQPPAVASSSSSSSSSSAATAASEQKDNGVEARLKWLRVGATGGNAQAMRLLSLLLLSTAAKVVSDNDQPGQQQQQHQEQEQMMQEAKEWMRRAAAAGDPVARSELAKEKSKEEKGTHTDAGLGFSFGLGFGSGGFNPFAFSNKRKELEDEAGLAARLYLHSLYLPIAAARVKGEGGVTYASLSPDGLWMVVATDEVGLLVYDVSHVDALDVNHAERVRLPLEKLTAGKSTGAGVATATGNSNEEEQKEQPVNPSLCTDEQHQYFVGDGSDRMPHVPSLLPVLRLPIREAYKAAFSPDGRFLCAAGYGAELLIWHVGVDDPSAPAGKVGAEGKMPVKRPGVRWKVAVRFAPGGTCWRFHWLQPSPAAVGLRVVVLSATALCILGTARDQATWYPTPLLQVTLPHHPSALAVCRMPSGWTSSTVSASAATSCCYVIATASALARPVQLWQVEETPSVLLSSSAPAPITVGAGTETTTAGQDVKQEDATGSAAEDEDAADTSRQSMDSEQEMMLERIEEDERFPEDAIEDTGLLRAQLASLKHPPQAEVTVKAADDNTAAAAPVSVVFRRMAAYGFPSEYANDQASVGLYPRQMDLTLVVGDMRGNITMARLDKKPLELHSVAMVEQQYQQLAQVEQKAQTSALSKQDAFVKAAREGDVALMSSLYQHHQQQGGVTLDGLESGTHRPQNAMVAAVSSSQTEAVGWLLQQDASLCNNAVTFDSYGSKTLETPLSIAVRNSTVIAAMLLEAKADVHCMGVYDGGPLVHAAVAAPPKRAAELIKLLKRFGADFNHPSGQYVNGESPLHMAVFHDYAQNVQLLLDVGADKDVPDGLSFACRRKHKASFDVLMRAGARTFGCLRAACDKFIHDKEEEIAMQMVRELLLKGADCDVNETDGATGETALHVAAASGWLQLCRLLIAEGARVEQRSYKGRLAVHSVRKPNIPKQPSSTGSIGTTIPSPSPAQQKYDELVQLLTPKHEASGDDVLGGGN